MREFKENLKTLDKALHFWKRAQYNLSTIRLVLFTTAAEKRAKGLQLVSIKSKLID